MVTESRKRMTSKEAIKILATLNQWRRMKKPFDKADSPCPFEPNEIGEAIDFAVKKLKSLINDD